jgi:hypothetical protein
MKKRISFVIVLLLLALVACVPVSISTPTTTPTFTVMPTSTPIPVTLTPQPTKLIIQSNVPTSTPFVNEKASEDCFLNIDFIPQKTGMNEVISSWKQPHSKSSLGDYEDWYFDFVGTPRINFYKQVIDTVNFSLKDCSLEQIFSKLGTPEKVEITVLVSCIGGPTMYLQYLHYQSLGYSFYRSCDETQNCFTFHATDKVSGKEFYPLNKVIEDSTGFNTASYVYNWHGFDVDVEKIENKIEDFDITNIVTRTPTP